MVLVELVTVVLCMVLAAVAIVGGVLLIGFRSALRPFLQGIRPTDAARDAIGAGEAVQAIMGERDGQARMALLLRSAGLNAMPHRDGMLLVQGGTGPLTPLLHGRQVPGVLGSAGSSPWPSRGIWIGEAAWAALVSRQEGGIHPVAMLEAIRNARSTMPYEGGTLAQGLLADDGAHRLPPSLAGNLHVPVSLFTPSEKEAVMSTLARKGAPVTEGDLAASITTADLLDRAAARQRARAKSGQP